MAQFCDTELAMNNTQSRLYGPLFGSHAMSVIFSDEKTIQAMLDVEAALARTEARLGVIPEIAAKTIESACKVNLYDLDALGAAAAWVGNPVIPLVKALTEQAGEAGAYVHWGTTTQDITDSGLVLQLIHAFNHLDENIASMCKTLAGLAHKHRDDPMAGRTFMQHALPVTFGLRAAGWLSAILYYREKLPVIRTELAVLQFSGAVGTLASLGDRAGEIQRELAKELGLGSPDISWHTDRSRILSAASYIAGLASSIGKIATDVVLLAQTEVGEVAEAAGEGRGGSSALPQKRNPIVSVAAKASTSHVQALLATIATSGNHDHERGSGAWHAEWLSLADMFILTSGALERMGDILDGLDVNTARMRANLELTNGMIMAEAVMMALAPEIGRAEAHIAVTSACKVANSENRHLCAIMKAGPHGKLLSDTEWDNLFEPITYTGRAGANIDAVLSRYNQKN